MPEIELYDSVHLENMEKVATLTLQGMNATEVSRATGLKRKDVLSLIDEWKDTAMVDRAMRDRAMDALNAMVKHYDLLIKQSYAILDDLKGERFTHQIAAQMNTTLKNISEYEARRVDALNKAGLLDASEFGDELASMEEKQAKLISILRNDLCANCRKVVGTKLSQITNQPEVIIVHE